jgi:uncharacterized SAM-binding protein YcdF (DUF218 family)
MSALFHALLSPLGTGLLFVLLGLLLAGACASRPARRTGRWLAMAGWLWLFVWSTPLASQSLRAWLERQPGPRLVDDVPPAPAIVVLGGGVAGATPPWRAYPDMGSGADRVWHAARLFHAGKAPLVVLSGGQVKTGLQTEADAMQTLLHDLGVPVSAMVQEDDSHNTQTNATHTARLLADRGIHRVILVTSALHMPRARQHFEAAGLAVVPAPTDIEVTQRFNGWHDLLPDAHSLGGSTRAFKELVGRWLGR